MTAPPGSAHPPESPTVSVIIPAYESALYIGEALESVFAQSYREFEVVVVNDGSPDTEELERVLAPFAKRIVYRRQPNGGPSSARNTAIREARGEYVAFLDSDDCWHPDFLASQIDFLRPHPELDLVYADATFFGEGEKAGETFMGRHPSAGPVTLESLLRGSCVVLTSSVVARRAALLDAGLFDESLRFHEDFELWLRLLHQGGRIGYQERVLGRRRAHPQSLTARRGDFLRGQLDVLERTKKSFALSPDEVAVIESRSELIQAELALVAGKERLLAGEYRLARGEFQRAAEHFRTPKLRGALLLLRLWPGLLRRVVQLRERTATGAA